MTTTIEQKIADAVTSGEMTPEEALQWAMQVAEQGDPEETAAQEEAERKASEARRERLTHLGLRLLQDAQAQVSLRQTTEERWYQDVRQFNGIYDPGTFTDQLQYGSRVFVPLTRRLVNLCEARLFDMLFPTDDRSFVIEPTPVPDLGHAENLADQLPDNHPIDLPGGPTVTAGAVRESIRAVREEAQKRNDAMQREIDDQLAECHYPQAARDAIHDAVLLGTGVLKGPVPMMKKSKRWQVDPQTGAHTMVMTEEPVPVTTRVDLWNFFPDMSCTNQTELEIVFERHYLTKRQMAALKDMPGVDEEALRVILGAEPTAPTNNYRERLRSINGASGAPDHRYEVWEYHGPITAQELLDCGVEIEEEDVLMQFTGTVWFCGPVVFKAALNPMDSGSLPYRIFHWQKDESSLFGFGLPYEVRDQQVSANSSWRAMLDNMGLCVMPQIIIDESSVEPVNGSYGLEPGKFWRNKKPGSDARQGIQFVEINSRLQELQAIFTASKALIEEVGTMPGFMQGQDAPAKMQSATEASISWTAANLWVRRCVRNWDDDITTPLIGDYYDYNMQWSPKEDIKGDSQVRALGITALVELEGEASRLQQLAQAAAGMGIALSSQYSMLRELSRALKLDPDRWLPSEEELQKMKQQEQQQGPKPDPTEMKIQAMQEGNQLRYKLGMAGMDLKREELDAHRQDMVDRMHLEVTNAAAHQNLTQEQAQQKYGFEMGKTQAEIQDRQDERAHQAQMLNAELAVKVQTGTGV